MGGEREKRAKNRLVGDVLAQALGNRPRRIVCVSGDQVVGQRLGLHDADHRPRVDGGPDYRVDHRLLDGRCQSPEPLRGWHRHQTSRYQTSDHARAVRLIRRGAVGKCVFRRRLVSLYAGDCRPTSYSADHGAENHRRHAADATGKIDSDVMGVLRIDRVVTRIRVRYSSCNIVGQRGRFMAPLIVPRLSFCAILWR